MPDFEREDNETFVLNKTNDSIILNSIPPKTSKIRGQSFAETTRVQLRFDSFLEEDQDFPSDFRCELTKFFRSSFVKFNVPLRAHSSTHPKIQSSQGF